MIAEGQRLTTVKTGGGPVAVAVQRAHKRGERFVLGKTADGIQSPIFVTGAKRTGARAIKAKTADGVIVPVKFAPDWLQVMDEPKVWYGVAVSATGQYMMAVEGNRLWRSTNYGETFSLAFTAPEEAEYDIIGVLKYNLYDCYMSASGQYCAAIPVNWDVNEINGTRPYDTWWHTSSDYGENWTLRTRESLDIEVPYGVAISSTGQYMTICRFNGVPLYSSDYGETFDEGVINPDNPWIFTDACALRNGIAMTTDGATQIIANRGNAGGTTQIIKSTDYGETWYGVYEWGFASFGRYVEQGPVVISDNGQIIVFSPPESSGIIYSVNGGSTWTVAQINTAGASRREWMAASGDCGYIGAGGSVYSSSPAAKKSRMLRTASFLFDDWNPAREGSEDQIIFPRDDGTTTQLTGLAMSKDGVYWLAATSQTSDGDGNLYVSRDFGRRGDFVALPEPE